MTIPEIVAQVRVALGICVSANKDVSPAERSHFTAMQNNSSDEDVISFWLSVSYLDNQSGVDVYRHPMGATGDQYQRVDGTLGMEYRSTGKQLTCQLLWSSRLKPD